MASITSVGVGSGLDLETLIGDILAGERSPVESRLTRLEVENQATISAFGNLKGTLSAFQSSLENLTDSSFFSSRKATSGDSSSFTATADSSANVANYNIAVLALAQESKVATNGGFDDPSATVGEGTLTIGFTGGSNFEITVAATDNLSDIRDAINDASDNIGVTANLLTVDAGMGDGSTITELVLTSNSTGAANQIDIAVADTGDPSNTDNLGLSRFYFDGTDPDAVTNQLINKDSAQDASITVDGFTAFSSSNTFSTVIDGISITALKEDDTPLTPTTATLTIEHDTSAVKSAVTSFVGNYNELIIVMNELTNYNASTEKPGLLGNDSSARAIESQIRRVLTGIITDAPADFNNLAFLGIATNRNGSITLDEDEFDKAISANFDNMASLFSGDNGIATRMDELLESFLGAGGTLATKEDILKGELREIEQERFDLGFRLEKIEERLRSQFAALDILVSQLNSTGNFLTQQLDAAAKIVNRNNS